MMKKIILLVAFLGVSFVGMQAQRMTDQLDRGLVAVKVQSGVYCSWRIYGEEYYDVKYNLYRDGVKIAENLTTSNYTDIQGTSNNKYTVAAVVRGKEQTQSKLVSPLTNNYLEITPKHDSSITSTLVPNDACCADVDGDGQVEILLKYDNVQEINNGFPKNGNNGEYTIFEVLTLDGTVLWWVNCGPNMGDFQNNEQNIVGYDWDLDGKAEVVMRLAEGSVIHQADGTTYTIGADGKNGTSWTNYREPKTGGVEWFTHYGKEFLVYCNGQNGNPYVVMDFPLKRLESGETDLNKAWGDGYGHRSSKYFFGAPYLDGRKPSIFLARGIYTRHKMIAYDVDPATHQLTERWRWNCNDSNSPYYGQGFHNYGIADVDMDGRDEICFGSMVIDDNGKGLSTTGLGHGDAQHHGDFDPYRPGLEIYTCQEEKPNNCFRDATTAKILYRSVGTSDDGRSMAGNFCNDYPGAIGLSARDEAISCVTRDHVSGLAKNDVTQNFRIYWDGDLCEESFNYINGKNTSGGIYKYGKGLIATLTGSLTNNDTKGTPCYQGDLFGDWREEVIMRTANNNIRIYTTTTETNWRNYTLWHDHQYRNAMVWQMCGYNQPPHVSYFMGELEGITATPPALTMTGRTEVKNGGTISNNDETVITCETNDMVVKVAEGASPYLYIDNAPSWVQGTNSISTTNPTIKYDYYTHTLTGGAFSGNMRLVKQGDGTLVLPKVTETYSGDTEVWAGKLQFDGTMQNSHVWLNRHTTLLSGGSFPKGIKADYNATIQPGGEGTTGTLSVSELSLGFGSRVVFDIHGNDNDKINVATLIVEKKTWPKGGGPAYDSPIFYINGSLESGRYTLGKIDKIDGDLSDIRVEGHNDKKTTLTLEDGILYLNVQSYIPQNLTWTGAIDGVWNIDITSNFRTSDGQSAVFVPRSTMLFDDNASKTDIQIQGYVWPASLTFINKTKDFTIQGDSIVGEPELSKTGAGKVTLLNKNRVGNTSISEGELVIRTLANNQGTEFGSLGDVTKTITIQSNGTLAVGYYAPETIACDQIIKIGEGGGCLNVVSGKTLLQSGAIMGAGQVFTKTGSGTLNTPVNFGVGKLVVKQGTVQATENSNAVKSLPPTVAFEGGILKDNVNIYSYSTNNANFVVPEEKTGTFYADSRCNYKGTLTGKGTFNVYATSVRGYFQGNWSNFEGTVVANTYSTDKYDDSFFFDNTYGLPKATLKISNGVVFDNNGKNMAIGAVTGTGTLGGSGTYTIGGQNDDIKATFSSDAPIVKKGSGQMHCSVAGALRKSLTMEGGQLVFYGSSEKAFFTSSISLKGTSSLAGSGLISSLTMESGTEATFEGISPIDFSVMPGTLKTTAAVNVKDGAVLNFQIQAGDTYSKLLPTFLTVNGTVKVTLLEGYTPQKGDSFTLWETVRTFSGTPKFDLPVLPVGLYWNTTAMAGKTGVLSITDDPTVGIGTLSADVLVTCEVYTIGGMHVGSLECCRGDIRREVQRLGVKAGVYVVKMQGGRNFDSETVIVR